MSLSHEEQELIGRSIERCGYDLASALIVVVRALARQPGFDLKGFAEALNEEQEAAKKTLPSGELTRSTLFIILETPSQKPA
jgi:hypothetical protein